VVELELPNLCDWPTKERKELIDFFIRTKSKQLRKPRKLKLTKEVEKFLWDYPFPGNVRELENLIESLYVFFEDDEITHSDLPKRLFENDESESLNWKTVEQQLIIKALETFPGKQGQGSWGSWLIYTKYSTLLPIDSCFPCFFM
jgi:transcriptional regulator of acetoin/glycerol metabolism